MKELTESQVNNIKEKLIKFKNDLIMKNNVNNRIEKDSDDHYGNTKYKDTSPIIRQRKRLSHIFKGNMPTS